MDLLILPPLQAPAPVPLPSPVLQCARARASDPENKVNSESGIPRKVTSNQVQNLRRV